MNAKGLLIASAAAMLFLSGAVGRQGRGEGRR